MHKWAFNTYAKTPDLLIICCIFPLNALQVTPWEEYNETHEPSNKFIPMKTKIHSPNLIRTCLWKFLTQININMNKDFPLWDKLICLMETKRKTKIMSQNIRMNKWKIIIIIIREMENYESLWSIFWKSLPFCFW